MCKKDIYRKWCGTACCLVFILALSGCSASSGAQRNQASGAPLVEGAADNQQEAGNQQAIENPHTMTGQEIENDQNATNQEMEGQQNITGQEIGNQQNVTEQGMGIQQNITGQETTNQQNMTDQDLGYHQYDEPTAGHHSSGNITSHAQGAQQNISSDSMLSGNNGIDLETAKSIALQNVGVDSANAVFTKAELDYDDGVAEYEVEFVAGSTKYEYEISAADGTVLKSSQEAVEQISGGVSSQASMSVEEAKSIALNYAKVTADQVVYTKSELDYDDGRAEYEIEFYAGGKEYSFTIDAVSGMVLEMEID